MSSERYEDCDVCEERFVGEQAIRSYIRTVDSEGFYMGRRSWECSSVCVTCLQKQKKKKRKA